MNSIIDSWPGEKLVQKILLKIENVPLKTIIEKSNCLIFAQIKIFTFWHTIFQSHFSTPSSLDNMHRNYKYCEAIPVCSTLTMKTKFRHPFENKNSNYIYGCSIQWLNKWFKLEYSVVRWGLHIAYKADNIIVKTV